MILSFSIIEKSGKVLLARQFTRMGRSQVLGHLAALHRLLTQTDQSYIETETIRYVFRSVDNLLFVLLTSTDSNILEDLSLLDFIIKLINESVDEISSSSILQDSLDLFIAIDEVIFDGYRQSVTLDEVDVFLKMESKEEELYLMEQEEREQAAKLKLQKFVEEQDKIRKSERSIKQTFTPFFKDSPADNDVPTYMEEETPQPKPQRKVTRTSQGRGMEIGRKTQTRDRARQLIIDEGLDEESD